MRINVIETYMTSKDVEEEIECPFSPFSSLRLKFLRGQVNPIHLW